MKWSWVGWVAWVLITGFIALSLYVDSHQLNPASSFNPDLFHIKNVSLIGYSHNKPTWRITTPFVRVKHSNLWELKSVKNGRAWDQSGNLVLSQLTASHLNLMVNDRQLMANERVSFVLQQEQASSLPIVFYANFLSLLEATQEATLQNKVHIVQGNLHIWPTHEVKIDLDKRTLRSSQGCYLSSPAMRVTGNECLWDFHTATLTVSGDVRLIRRAEKRCAPTMDSREKKIRSKDLFITCSTLSFDHTKDRSSQKASGKLVIFQKGSIFKSDFGYHDPRLNTYTLLKNVRVQTNSLSFLLKNPKSFRNKTLKACFSSPIHITCDLLIFDLKNHIFSLKGSVKIIQKNHTITCEKVFLNDDSHLLSFIGNVFVKETSGQLFEASELRYNLLTEDMSANNRIHTLIKINRKKS